jgi:hypothetical protein
MWAIGFRDRAAGFDLNLLNPATAIQLSMTTLPNVTSITVFI